MHAAAEFARHEHHTQGCTDPLRRELASAHHEGRKLQIKLRSKRVADPPASRQTQHQVGSKCLPYRQLQDTCVNQSNVRKHGHLLLGRRKWGR